MSSFVIVHITPALPLELSIHICLHTNNRDIFCIRQEFVHCCSAPFRITRWGRDTFCIKHIHNFPQTGSSKIVSKYTADSIRLFFMNNDFIVN